MEPKETKRVRRDEFCPMPLNEQACREVAEQNLAQWEEMLDGLVLRLNLPAIEEAADATENDKTSDLMAGGPGSA